MNVKDNVAVALAESLMAAIGPAISTFKIRKAPVVDNSGLIFDAGPLIVHSPAAAGMSVIPIDAVAAVVECHETLTMEALRESYARIESIKLADKATKGVNPQAAVDMTTAFIVARTSALTIEEIAGEVARLNSKTSSQQWPDAVAILSVGLINYTAHVVGREEGGDFFLYSKEVLNSNTPPASMYVNLLVRGMGKRTLNKVVSLLIVRVAIFEPGIGVPDYRLLLEGIPKHGLPKETYQPNLASRLKAMSVRQELDSRLRFEVFEVESAGKSLGSIQFMDWQDGGVFVARGSFPILPFFLCVKQVQPSIPFEHMQYVASASLIVSYVLPITRVHFMQMLSRFEQLSANMRIKPRSAKLLIQQVGDEGVSSPFISRLMVGILEMRDVVHTSESERLRFDDLYDPVLSGARETREACREIKALWESHKSSIDAGTIVQFSGGHTRIAESIDRQLKKELDSFLITAVRTAKSAMQNLAHDYGVDIGFVFKKEGAFLTGIEQLSLSDVVLAKYLEQVRAWTEPLVAARNNLEHGVVQPPKVIYRIEQRPIVAVEPVFGGKLITEYTNDALQRLLSFIEEMTIYCLSRKMPDGLQVSEIALKDRVKAFPRRFQLSVPSGGRGPWRPSAGDARFDLT